jgi:aerobic carbon-monoxide dehydrogenase medium subunit
MKPAAFAYHRAESVEEAVGLLAELGDDAKVLAGGQSLVAMMNFRLVRPTALVDINPVRGLGYIIDDRGDGGSGGGLRIGAMTRHRDVERYPGLLGGLDVLPRAARWVGHYPIRTRGTFGGSLAHADPSAEWCVLSLLLDAEILVTGPDGVRVVAAQDFFRGFLEPALAHGELVTEVRFPRRVQRAGFQEFNRRHGDFMIVGAGVAFDLDDGRCRDVRIALGGVGATPVRVPEAEAVLEGELAGPDAFVEAGRAAAAAIDPPGDLHGSSAYRRELASVLIGRAAHEALDDVG